MTTTEPREEQFFEKFNEPALLEPGIGVKSLGSKKAAEHKVQYEVLARGIPALSFAAATHAVPGAQGNFDMYHTMKTDETQWPTESHTETINQGSWRHSDMRDVALLHVYKLYQQMINLGNLKQ
jgi:hypothetical protein